MESKIDNLNILEDKYILTNQNILDIKGYISKKYPNYSNHKSAKIFANTVNQIIDKNLKVFSNKNRTQLKEKIYNTAIKKNDFTISAQDIVSACIEVYKHNKNVLDEFEVFSEKLIGKKINKESIMNNFFEKEENSEEVVYNEQNEIAYLFDENLIDEIINEDFLSEFIIDEKRQKKDETEILQEDFFALLKGEYRFVNEIKEYHYTIHNGVKKNDINYEKDKNLVKEKNIYILISFIRKFLLDIKFQITKKMYAFKKVIHFIAYVLKNIEYKVILKNIKLLAYRVAFLKQLHILLLIVGLVYILQILYGLSEMMNYNFKIVEKNSSKIKYKEIYDIKKLGTTVYFKEISKTIREISSIKK